jgi:hypothetical protein
MSGVLHAAPPAPPPGAGASSQDRAMPLLTPDQAAALLDHVIFERVVDCIDLDGIAQVERSLSLMLADIEGVPSPRAGELARAILERAVRRLPDDLLGYADLTNILSLDCELCMAEEEDDRRAPASAATGANRRRPAAHRRR